jgi:cytidine deaminase
MIALTGWANDDAVIVAATELAATLGDDPNHTVAAAALGLNGNIYTGVNNHHFNGGPCAELVVLGVAASAHAGGLATIVAVGDGGRRVISPCGRCRHVMLDQHPDICVLAPLEDGIQSARYASSCPFLRAA